MTDTCGPPFAISSKSTDLQSCLESRLRANSEGLGSPMFKLIWKHWDMPQRQQICAVRASALPKGDNVCTGWPTPRVGGNGRTGRRYKGRLEDAATLAHHGPNSTLELIDMARAAPLNPALSAWLMGYTREFLVCFEKALETASSPK